LVTSAHALPSGGATIIVCKEREAMRPAIRDRARQLFEAQGPTAVAEAARKAASLESEGKQEHAEVWRQIEQALKQMQGTQPH
jgi:hypothetical protein